jgi:hypothetical protein
LPKAHAETPRTKLTSWIIHITVVITGLKVAQRRSATGRVRHDPQTAVDDVLLPKLTKDPPDALHEARVHGLVTVLKVDPSTSLFHNVLPLVGVLQDDGATLGVVLVDTHRHDVGFRCDVELLVDLMLDWETMGVPTETPLDMVTSRVGISRDDVL